MGLESPSSRAERMAATLSIWGRVIPLEETVARIDAVNVDSVRRILKRITRSRPSLALYGPVSKAGPVEAVVERLTA
ncbi:MAG: insulinase family protein, partial [Pseudomonadota bacterium]